MVNERSKLERKQKVEFIFDIDHYDEEEFRIVMPFQIYATKEG